MKRRDWLFILIVVVVVGGLYLLSRKTGRIPPMPVNEAHQASNTREQCLACHTVEKMTALMDARKHPGKWRDARVSCLQCHKHAATNTSQLIREQSPQVLIAWLNHQQK